MGDRWRWELGADWSIPREVQRDSTTRGSFCVGIAAGQVRGRGLEPLLVVRRSSWLGSIERLAIGLQVQLLVPLTRGRFVIGDVEVDRIAAIGVRGLAGIEVRLP